MTEPTPDLFGNLLARGTAKRETVTIYGDQTVMHDLIDLYAQAEDINKRIESNPERTLQRAAGEKSPEALLRREADALQAKITEAETRAEASMSTWTLRALTRAELREINDRHREPMAPMLPPKSAPKSVKEQWGLDRDKWRADASAIGEARVLAEIALAVVSVETADGVIDSVSVEQLRALLDGEYGDDHISRLAAAVQSASKAERDMPRPFSQTNSQGSQD